MSDLPVLKNLKKAVPLSVSYDSQIATLLCNGSSSRDSSVLPTDYCRTSIPLGYFETSWESSDVAAHDVQLYSDIDASWISYQGGNSVVVNNFIINITNQYCYR